MSKVFFIDATVWLPVGLYSLNFLNFFKGWHEFYLIVAMYYVVLCVMFGYYYNRFLSDSRVIFCLATKGCLGEREEEIKMTNLHKKSTPEALYLCSLDCL